MVTIEIIIYESYLDRSVGSCYLFDQRSEDRGRKAEVGRQGTEGRGRRSEDRARRSEVGRQSSEVGRQRSEVGRQRSEVER